DDLPRRSLALHPRLADDDLRRREATRDRRDDVAARRRVGSGQDPDCARDAWQGELPLGREEPLLREAPLEAFERDEVLAEPEPLDGRHAKRELAARLPDLGSTLGMDRLALLEPKVESVECTALDGRLERRSGGRVTEGEEDRCPRLAPAQLRDLALPPHAQASA